MSWDLFLMKKLLKSEICESVNSAGYTVHRGKVNLCGYCSWTIAALLPETRENKKRKRRMKREFTNAGAALAQSKRVLNVKQFHVFYAGTS